MFNKLTYKNKFVLLIAGFFIFLFIVYSFAIKKTINTKKQNKEIEKQLIIINDAPAKIADYELQLKKIENIIGEKIILGQDVHELLLERVSKYCQDNRLILRELPMVHKFNQNDYTIETSVVVIEGTYLKLLKLLFALETEKIFGKITSANFKSYKDFKTRKIRLTLTIYIQNIKKGNYDD
ncbi:MAG: hypothetical protein KAT68_02930 [Bacteroidales bacterium]|nr:hypothetical protein [Bacteroidales bacterium]